MARTASTKVIHLSRGNSQEKPYPPAWNPHWSRTNQISPSDFCVGCSHAFPDCQPVQNRRV